MTRKRNASTESASSEAQTPEEQSREAQAPEVQDAPPRRIGAANVLAGLGLLAIAGAHVAWAFGSAWPASSRKKLAKAVAGDGQLPPAEMNLLFAAGYALAARQALSRKAGLLAKVSHVGVTAALAARAAYGGEKISRALQLPTPSSEFLAWDRKLYRPVAGVLAALLVIGGRSRRR